MNDVSKFGSTLAMIGVHVDRLLLLLVSVGWIEPGITDNLKAEVEPNLRECSDTNMG
jgi:hypothetical protein